MKYIKTFESDKWQPFYDIFQRKFGISIDEIYDLLSDVQDEFLEVDIYIDDAESSGLVIPDNENIFVIYFQNKDVNDGYLNQIETYMQRNHTLDQMNSYLSDFGLVIYGCDFSRYDEIFEIVICRKGTKVINNDVDYY